MFLPQKKDILDSLILAYKLSLGVDKTSFYRKTIGRGGEKDQRLSKEHGVLPIFFLEAKDKI